MSPVGLNLSHLGYNHGVDELHALSEMRMVGEPEDELVTVLCACGWESARVWACEDSVSAAFQEHLRSLVTAVN